MCNWRETALHARDRVHGAARLGCVLLGCLAALGCGEAGSKQGGPGDVEPCEQAESLNQAAVENGDGDRCHVCARRESPNGGSANYACPCDEDDWVSCGYYVAGETGAGWMGVDGPAATDDERVAMCGAARAISC